MARGMLLLLLAGALASSRIRSFSFNRDAGGLGVGLKSIWNSTNEELSKLRAQAAGTAAGVSHLVEQAASSKAVMCCTEQAKKAGIQLSEAWDDIQEFAASKQAFATGWITSMGSRLAERTAHVIYALKDRQRDCMHAIVAPAAEWTRDKSSLLGECTAHWVGNFNATWQIHRDHLQAVAAGASGWTVSKARPFLQRTEQWKQALDPMWERQCSRLLATTEPVRSWTANKTSKLSQGTTQWAQSCGHAVDKYRLRFSKQANEGEKGGDGRMRVVYLVVGFGCGILASACCAVGLFAATLYHDERSIAAARLQRQSFDIVRLRPVTVATTSEVKNTAQDMNADLSPAGVRPVSVATTPQVKSTVQAADANLIPAAVP